MMLQFITLLLGFLSFVFATEGNNPAVARLSPSQPKRSTSRLRHVLVRREYGSSILRGFETIYPLNFFQMTRAALYDKIGDDTGKCLCREAKKRRLARRRSLDLPYALDDIVVDTGAVYGNRKMEHDCVVDALRDAPQYQREMEKEFGFSPDLNDSGPLADTFITDFHLNFRVAYQQCKCNSLLESGISMKEDTDPYMSARNDHCTAVGLRTQHRPAPDTWRPAPGAAPASRRLLDLLKRNLKELADKVVYPPPVQAFSVQGAVRGARLWGGVARSAVSAKLALGVERVLQAVRNVRRHGPSTLTSKLTRDGAPWAPAQRGVGGALRPAVPGGVIHRHR